MPISVLAKGCSKKHGSLIATLSEAGRRLGWVGWEDRCLEGLARSLLGGLKEGVAARDWAGAERKGRWEPCGPGQARLRLRWERDWTMTVARCCAAAGSILGLGSTGFKNWSVVGWIHARGQVGRLRSRLATSKHYEYVQISGTGCRPHDASPPASDETGPVSASASASDGGTLPPWSVTGNQSAPHCGSHAAYREA